MPLQTLALGLLLSPTEIMVSMLFDLACAQIKFDSLKHYADSTDYTLTEEQRRANYDKYVEAAAVLSKAKGDMLKFKHERTEAEMDMQVINAIVKSMSKRDKHLPRQISALRSGPPGLAKRMKRTTAEVNDILKAKKP